MLFFDSILLFILGSSVFIFKRMSNGHIKQEESGFFLFVLVFFSPQFSKPPFQLEQALVHCCFGLHESFSFSYFLLHFALPKVKAHIIMLKTEPRYNIQLQKKYPEFVFLRSCIELLLGRGTLFFNSDGIKQWL